MAEVGIHIELENEKAFLAAIKRAKEVTDDLRVPLTLIAKDFYRSEQYIFDQGRKSAGQYQDLSKKYKAAKQAAVGFVYPILLRTGRLRDSVTNPTHPEAINQIVNKDTLVIGTRVPYGIFHQARGARGKMPYRPFLFIGAEAPQFANSDQLGRKGRWLNILNGFVLRKMKAEIGDE